MKTERLGSEKAMNRELLPPTEINKSSKEHAPQIFLIPAKQSQLPGRAPHRSCRFARFVPGRWCVGFMRASVEESGLLTTSVTGAASQLDACNCSPAQTQFVHEMPEGKPENSIVGLERACSHDVVVNC